MRQRSDTWKTIAASGKFSMEVKAKIGDSEYTAISAPVIENTLLGDDTMSVGNCSAASMRVTIRTSDIIAAAAEVEIFARLTDGTTYSEWLTFGKYYISKRATSNGLVSLECYDAMLKASQQYVDPTSSDTDRVGWPKSMETCVNEIASRIGVSLDSRINYIVSSFDVDYPTNYTMLEVLGYIGACNGGNWIITPENKLMLVSLAGIGGGNITQAFSDATVETVDIPVVIGAITTGNTVTISRVSITRDESLGYTKGDDTGAELLIENNPYASQDICDNICSDLSGISYTPFTATNACFDPCLELGDTVVIGDHVTAVLFKQTVTLGVSFRADLSTPSKDETEDEYPYLTEIEKLNLKAERLQSYLDDTNYTITSIEQTNNEIKASVSEVSKSNTENASAISALKMTVEGISLSTVKKDTGGAYLQLTNGKGGTDEIQLKFTVSTGSTSAVLKMTAGDVTIASSTLSFTGYATYASLATSGSTIIDGSNITTGTINAERIKFISGSTSESLDSHITSEISSDLNNNLTISVSNASSEIASTITIGYKGTEISSGTIRFTGVVTFDNLETSGETIINGDNITTGTIDANSVALSSGDYGGFACAEGNDGTSDSTRGAMMFGPVDGSDDPLSKDDFSPTYYFIATNAGVRMQARSTYFYCSRYAIVASEAIDETSDRRIKNSITYDMSRYEQFYQNLQPCVYKRNDGTSGRFHSGFIAQDVETAITSGGLTTQDFAGLVIEQKDTGEAYSLRYSEFIAMNTYMIQKLYARVEELEKIIKELGG